MTNIRTRNDLINWLEPNAPIRAIARALQEGEIEVLGAFSEIPPFPYPGWIVNITSLHLKTWCVAISVNKQSHEPRAWILSTDKIPWKFWIGEFANSKLFQGDNPEKYKELRENINP